MMDEAKIKAVSSCEFFRDLSDDSRRLLLPLLQEASFRKNEFIFLKEDPALSMYFVLHGEVEISISTEDGKKIIHNILSSGASFGEIGVLDGGNRTADAIALENSALLKLDRSDLLKAMSEFHPAEWIRLVQRLCSLLRKVNYNFESLCLTNAETRLVAKLIELGQHESQKKTGSLTLKISQSQLAEMTNLSRETTNKILSQMEKKGQVKRSYGKIILVDLPERVNTI